MRTRFMVIEYASARDVADRWRGQYERDGKWMRTVSGDSETTYNRLCALGPTPSIADAADVIGNKSWSYLSCTSCRSSVERVVRFTEGWDEELRLCAKCVNEAAQVVKEMEK